MRINFTAIALAIMLGFVSGGYFQKQEDLTHGVDGSCVIKSPMTQVPTSTWPGTGNTTALPPLGQE
jgi:hypothetical protein